MKVAITGGGTGGHLTIAKAIKEELVKKGFSPIFIGSSNGQDKRWFEDDKEFEQKYFFDTGGVVNKTKVGKVLSLLNILRYSLKCRSIFKKHKINAVFSVGGYSSAPASIASQIFKKPLYIHEQNAIIGSLNKLLKSRAKAFFSSYHDDSPLKDYPVRDIFFQNARIRDEIKTIIFLGGSQGATAINNFAMKVAPTLKEKGISIIHQSGAKDYEKLKEFYHEQNIEVDLFDFTTNLEEKIKKADFAVSRSGASTMWELVASMLPALFVPYPYAAGDHQYHNALFLKEKSLCFLKRESELDISIMTEILNTDISKMSLGLNNSINQEGAKKIVEYMLDEQKRYIN